MNRKMNTHIANQIIEIMLHRPEPVERQLRKMFKIDPQLTVRPLYKDNLNNLVGIEIEDRDGGSELMYFTSRQKKKIRNVERKKHHLHLPITQGARLL